MSDYRIDMGRLILSLPVSKDSGTRRPHFLGWRFRPEGIILWLIVSTLAHFTIFRAQDPRITAIGLTIFLLVSIYVIILYLTKQKLEIYEKAIFYKVRSRLWMVAFYVPFKDIDKVLIERFFGGATFSLEMIRKDGMSVFLPAGKVAIFEGTRDFLELLTRMLPGKVDVRDADRPMF